MNRATVASALAIATVFWVHTGVAAQQEDPVRSIDHITGDLYRAQNDSHFTVFLVTPDGIILADPINRGFASWLRSEFEERFDLPVHYVLYTHHHWDHASGGEEFKDTAEYIGQENMLHALALPGGDLPLPDDVRHMDTDANGVIERNEASGDLSDRFDLIDENGDGVLSGAELIRGPLNDVYPPTVTYVNQHTVSLGGKTVVLIHTGPAHSEDMAVMYFPEERVVFGTDLLQVQRFPMGPFTRLGEWIDAYTIIDDLDFDILVPGHGIVGTKDDVTAFLAYLKDLGTGVAAGVAKGLSLEQIQESLTLDAYRGWLRYDTLRPVHIEHVYTSLMGSLQN